jgi:hypothetical protein
MELLGINTVPNAYISPNWIKIGQTLLTIEYTIIDIWDSGARRHSDFVDGSWRD